MAASGAGSLSETGHVCSAWHAERIWHCLAATATCTAQPVCAPGLWLAQSGASAHGGLWLQKKFYFIKLPYPFCETLVNLTRCRGAQLKQDLRAKVFDREYCNIKKIIYRIISNSFFFKKIEEKVPRDGTGKKLQDHVFFEFYSINSLVGN